MNKARKVLLIVTVLIVAASLLFPTTAFALTEDEVQQQINNQGREAVTGNVFIWFLCAIAFLKVSQKIDSFMSSLGINVGHTGGSMLAEAMIAARGVGMAKGFAGGFGKGGGHGSGGGSSGGSGGAGFLSGGLAGAVSRKFSQSAMHGATGQGGNAITKKAFNTSLAKGGSFANRIISSVAKGSVSQAGTITGQTASDALTSYMGYSGKDAADIPQFSNVEIGGGRITGVETSAENPNGLQFGMYNAEQYMEPSGDYSTVQTVDGSKWYMQYAQDSVKKEPYMNAEGKVAYNESIVKKLPDMPRRKDRV